MTDQPDDWLAAERERNGCVTVPGGPSCLADR
jgi:hypothetical protein